MNFCDLIPTVLGVTLGVILLGITVGVVVLIVAVVIQNLCKWKFCKITHRSQASDPLEVSYSQYMYDYIYLACIIACVNLVCLHICHYYYIL